MTIRLRLLLLALLPLLAGLLTVPVFLWADAHSKWIYAEHTGLEHLVEATTLLISINEELVKHPNRATVPGETASAIDRLKSALTELGDTGRLPLEQAVKRDAKSLLRQATQMETERRQRAGGETGAATRQQVQRVSGRAFRLGRARRGRTQRAR